MKIDIKSVFVMDIDSQRKTRISRSLSNKFCMLFSKNTLADCTFINYNDWEKIVIKTTTNGIPMVVVIYNR